MKNYFGIIIIFCLMLTLTAGCSNDAGQPAANNDDAQYDGVDVDLTMLGQSMMIAMINNIYATPGEYIGQTIKMMGQYTSVDNMDIGRRFHYVLNMDDSECCSYGFIFEYGGVYPDDFPEEGAHIEVSGTFGRGDAQGQFYHYLAIDGITIIKA